MKRIGKSINFGTLNINHNEVGQKNVEERLYECIKKKEKAFCLTVKIRKPARDLDRLIGDHNITYELQEGKAIAEMLFALLFTAERFPRGAFLSGEPAGGS